MASSPKAGFVWSFFKSGFDEQGRKWPPFDLTYAEYGASEHSRRVTAPYFASWPQLSFSRLQQRPHEIPQYRWRGSPQAAAQERTAAEPPQLPGPWDFESQTARSSWDLPRARSPLHPMTLARTGLHGSAISRYPVSEIPARRRWDRGRINRGCHRKWSPARRLCGLPPFPRQLPPMRL